MWIMTTKFCCHYLATWCQGKVFFQRNKQKTSNHEGTSPVFFGVLSETKASNLENLRETSGVTISQADPMQFVWYHKLDKIPGSTWDGYTPS